MTMQRNESFSNSTANINQQLSQKDEQIARLTSEVCDLTESVSKLQNKNATQIVVPTTQHTTKKIAPFAIAATGSTLVGGTALTAGIGIKLGVHAILGALTYVGLAAIPGLGWGLLAGSLIVGAALLARKAYKHHQHNKKFKANIINTPTAKPKLSINPYQTSTDFLYNPSPTPKPNINKAIVEEKTLSSPTNTSTSFFNRFKNTIKNQLRKINSQPVVNSDIIRVVVNDYTENNNSRFLP